jgi:TRAP-type C4-dicarboxylate transport system substrate-binding protein
MRAVAAALTAGAFAVGATACSGSDADKAGGTRARAPVVLTLAAHDELYAQATFAAAVERLSGGSMRIRIVEDPRDEQSDYERGIVRGVRSGKAQLGLVGARVWDTMGVTSFQALLAPMLVDSLTLERRALESPLAARALDGVERAGVVGVALLPGTLRRPLGFSRALIRPEDYEGTTVGIRPGGVAKATFAALGAEAKGSVPGEVAGLDGTELDLSTIAINGQDEDKATLTENVVLWPRVQTVFANHAAFGALTLAQRQILRRAGRTALGLELARVERDERSALSDVCRRGRLRFVTASPSDRAALRQAVQPVYDALEQTAQTKRWLGEIAAMRRHTAAEHAPRCVPRRTRAHAEAAIEGRWKVSWTRKELLAAALSPEDVRRLHGATIVDFAHGRFGTASHWMIGSYTVDGDHIRLVFETTVGVLPGRVYELSWSVYRDRLSFAAVPGREPVAALLIEPLSRVG